MTNLPQLGDKILLHCKIVEKRSINEFVIVDTTASLALIIKENKVSQAKYLDVGKTIKIVNATMRPEDRSIEVTSKTAIFQGAEIIGNLFQVAQENPHDGMDLGLFLTLKTVHEMDARKVRHFISFLQVYRNRLSFSKRSAKARKKACSLKICHYMPV